MVMAMSWLALGARPRAAAGNRVQTRTARQPRGHQRCGEAGSPASTPAPFDAIFRQAPMQPNWGDIDRFAGKSRLADGTGRSWVGLFDPCPNFDYREWHASRRRWLSARAARRQNPAPQTNLVAKSAGA